MGIDLIVSLIAGAASLAAGGLASSEAIQKLIRHLLGRKEPDRPYTERLAELTESLTKASREVDAVLSELAQVARNRGEAVQKLEADLQSLEGREKELKSKIDALEKTPLPVAEHFARLLEAGERRSAKRDYALFGAGVIVTTVIAVVIQALTGK